MLRRAWRRLRSAPVFTVFAVTSLALGVGVTTAIYSVVASLTSVRLDVANGDRIAMLTGLSSISARPAWRSAIARADFLDLRQTLPAWKDAAVSAPFVQSLVTPSVSELVSGEAVNGAYFTTLGLVPAAGRLVQASDDDWPSRVAVVSHQFWRTRLGENAAVVGTSVRIGGQPFEIIGIAPPEFGGLTDRLQTFTEVWVPIGATSMFPSNAAPPEDFQDRRRQQLSVFISMPTQSAASSLAREVQAVGERLDTVYPLTLRFNSEGAQQKVARGWTVRSIDQINRDVDAQFGRGRTLVMALVALVLVVACTNLANLVLARASGRHHELAVRRALGASRIRLILEELAETGLLAVLGAAGAFVIARLLIVWFASASLPVSESLIVQISPQVDVSTVGVAALSVLASLAVFGLAPALQVTRAPLRPQLATDGGATGQLRWRARRRLISLQVAISLAFTLIAIFTVRVALGERVRSSGIDVDRIAIGVVSFRLQPWTEVRAREAIDRLVELAPSQPQIEAVAVSSGLPFGTNYTPDVEIALPSLASSSGPDGFSYAPLIAATPTIFRVLGVEITLGRGFGPDDNAGAPPVIVLSRLTARQVFGSENVLGRQVAVRSGVRTADPGAVRLATVIGIAADTDTQRRYSRRAGAVYVPIAQHYEPTLSLVARTSDAPEEILPALKTLARRADPDLVVDRPATAAMALTGAYVLIGVVSNTAGSLALLALVLAMAGLFGVLSHLVSRRTREMGLRMALGADPARIRRLILGDGLRPVGVGIVLGLLVGLLARMLLTAAYASPISAGDVLIFLIAPVPIALSAVAACYWPARRAAAVDPNVALRDL